MNKVILIGRLTRDPELRTTPTNASVASFSIAVNRRIKQNDGVDADFFNCVIWNKPAENLAKYCHKGSQVSVEGRIQNRNYVGQDGNKRYITEIICDNVEFLSSKADNVNDNNGYQNNYPSYPNYPDNNGYQGNSNFNNNYSNNNTTVPEAIPDNSYSENPAPTVDIREDPFKDFGDEVTLTDDDLPF